MAVEADWPDAYRVNRYVRGASDDATAEEALGDFERFPPGCGATPTCSTSSGGCASATTRSAPTDAPKAGFYGLDLYSLHRSIDGGRRLPGDGRPGRRRAGPGALRLLRPLRRRTRRRTATRPPSALAETCEQEVVEQLVDLQRHGRRVRPARRADRRGRVLLRRAERARREERRGVLPRDVPRPGVDRGTCATGTWSTRSTRSSTISTGQRGRTKVVVWAHNSHLGDARATELGDRESSTSASSCASAPARVPPGRLHHLHGHGDGGRDWDGPAERKRVRPALAGSYEELFHEAA